MPIRVLSAQVASQIAAGEVVERPSSVVKELVENAIDAGARDIHVEVIKGGKQFIRVTDDGAGIPQAEVELAFERHSTSKLSTAEELVRIGTLGFRGEALASIASVSRVTLNTRTASEDVGTYLCLEGGQVVESRASGRPLGTTVTIEDLFYNVPARRSFLRSDLTERRHIDAWITRYAMAYPDLRLSTEHDGKERFRSPGSGRLRDVLVEVYGPDVGAELLEILPDAGSVDARQVSGFVSPPVLHRGNRSSITLFVNGRWIQDSRLTYAIVQAYHTLLPGGRYPVAVVMLDLPPEEVDVNVHPAKAEVRFRDAERIFRIVQRAVRQTVVGSSPVPTFSTPAAGAWEPRARPSAIHPSAVEIDRPVQLPMEPGREAAVSGIAPLRVVGQISGMYIVAEGEDGLYLIDQHAAHERVLYERLVAGHGQGEGAGQSLLEPAVVELPAQTAALAEENLALLEGLSLGVEHFGGNTFLVRSLPAVLTSARADEVLLDAVEALEEAGSRVGEEIEQAIVRRICKRAAVKAGQVLTRDEMEALVRGLENCSSPRTCPHGRPTMIRISVEQLAREFGRH
jgi:DNA mismatch repair protein MutL